MRVGRRAGDVVARRSARGRRSARNRPQTLLFSVDLPAPLRAEHGDDLAVAHLEVDAVQHLHAVIAGVQRLDVEEGGAHRAPAATRAPMRAAAPWPR